MNDEVTNSQGISTFEWEEQQDLIDRWVIELVERLKVDKEATGLALVDWVYINTDTDWLLQAAKQDSLDHQGYPRPMEGYAEELRSFLAAATKAWYDAWGEQPSPRTAEDVLELIGNLIDDFEEKN